MARVVFENLTMKQAKLLADWFEGQGEQNAEEWFVINGVSAPMANCQRKGGFMEIDEKTETVTVFTKTI